MPSLRSISFRPSATRRSELHRAEFRAVLLPLAARLRLLIVVELSLDAANDTPEGARDR
jgi:hypothetical protein